MEKILLAINGIRPDKRAFQYAVELCQGIKAELRVLQVVRPRHYRGYLGKVREKAIRARGFIEGSMTAATFAEAGDHETARGMMVEAMKNLNHLLPESEKAGIRYHVTMKAGDPGTEIVHFVKAHRDVVLTIYDAVQEDNQNALKGPGQKEFSVRKIRENLSVPLVVMRH
ncbi:universal stress protein [Thermodesulfobacteriota bacterium]